MRITEPAPAKINLALHVRARRPDGYHELETLFAFVEAGDVVSVEPAERDEFRISGPFGAALDAETDNLVTRARDRFRTAFGLPAVAIELVKNLPVASGIGGGSADAAATLRALARMTGIGADNARLYDLADGLGSDVPACLFGRTAMGRGRGEQLQPLTGAAGRLVLLINPGIAVSTAAVFARWDGLDRGPLRTDDVMAAALDGRNDLYPPARLVAPGIDAPLALLEAYPGVVLARMSGSGATCFALFDSEEQMMMAAEQASTQAGWWVCPTRLRP
ncbi:4-(cytidine 5'-diphospho)-2-C-methyl-D-erythritol kinase [Sphingomonas sp. BGYR3]|uniref:4-(cytidine 5'-diphospho)-2-C-methyl-D-erythritol kinase n=1 Tax=Sphingomonas sp. BGYR3 TaxID=2975483 RepID=UPI0021A8C284|nr:4-(cytidine 5'-diphospho)-2-C-methyl-D-erythritol kinase [Sphingomonas sp. BGYR3]MDG5487354.1 4-(cytidine 5'-diphospho)-2-C-methyl-D-erythritol kinase [Sphingomonas sp. BGYR3]